MSLAVLMGLGLAWSNGAFAGVPNSVPTVYTLHIESQPLDTALQDLARQTGMQILVFSRLTNNGRSAALDGMYTLDSALVALLTQSKLTYRFVNPKTIEILPVRTVPHRN